jgi:xanthine dehydrogenase iron-sulfur cluster and FAD-binding subunit A
VAGRKADRRLLDEAGDLLAEEISPIDDLRSTAEYRLTVSRNLLRWFLRPDVWQPYHPDGRA